MEPLNVDQQQTLQIVHDFLRTRMGTLERGIPGVHPMWKHGSRAVDGDTGEERAEMVALGVAMKRVAEHEPQAYALLERSLGGDSAMRRFSVDEELLFLWCLDLVESYVEELMRD
jgi:hypothetical protein